MSPAKKFILILVVYAAMLGTTSFANPLLGFFSAAVGASPNPWVGQEIIVAGKVDVEYEPAAAYNWKHNEYLVVWRGHDGIYGQRVSATGELVGASPFPIATGPKTRRHPGVDYDPVNDRYLVVWSGDQGSPKGWDIKARFIPWEGSSPLFKEFIISTGFSDDFNPEVAYARGQNPQEYLVVYESGGASTGEIWKVRIKASDGTILGPGHPERITSFMEVSRRPDVAYNLARNEYLVTWDVSKSSWDIYGARLRGDTGIMQPGIFKIEDKPVNETNPAVAACAEEDQYLVAWESEKSPVNLDIHAKNVVCGGVPSDTVHFVGGTPIMELMPDVACGYKGRQFLVVWQQQYSSASGPFGISGRFVYPETGGCILSPESASAPVETNRMSEIFAIAAPSANDADRAAPALAGGFGEYLAVWEHALRGTTDIDVHGKKVMPGANFLPVVIKR